MTNGYKRNWQLTHINKYLLFSAGSRLKIEFSSSDRVEEMRKVLIWMPKVWLTKATRVGRRRIKAAMVKGVQGKKKHQLLLSVFLRGTKWQEMCSLVLNQTWNFLRRWLGWCGRRSRSPPTRSPRARSPSHQRPAGSRGRQGCFSSNGWQTFTTSKNEICLATFCKEQQRSWFKMRTKHVLTGADAPIWGWDEV